MHLNTIFVCRTFKQGCPVHIKLRASLDGASLEVKSFDEEHNHELSKVAICDQ